MQQVDLVSGTRLEIDTAFKNLPQRPRQAKTSQLDQPKQNLNQVAQ